MGTYIRFEKNFSDQLSGSERWDPFVFIAEQLQALGRPINIVETGCSRKLDNWHGDGMSTILWDWLVADLGGIATSFDISEDSVAFARGVTSRVNVVQRDSVIGLREINANSIDLLYLDSYDWDGGDLTDPSPIHHLAELASVYADLPPNCLIAVDDCYGQDGKQKYVAKFLASLGVFPEIDGKVTIWRKPSLA